MVELSNATMTRPSHSASLADEHAKKILELEELSLTKAREEINSRARRAEEVVLQESASAGTLESGKFGKRIVEIHLNRAREIAARSIALRRESLLKCPSLLALDSFEALAESVHRGIERVVQSIPECLKRYGVHPMPIRGFGDQEELVLKAEASREIAILKKEYELMTLSQRDAELVHGSKDRRKVWVVHGRNSKAQNATFTFLRAIGLEPMEWNEALALTGKGSPYTGEVLDKAFEEAQAVVVLVTGEDMARIGTRYAESHDPPEETEPTPQARPNVIFEAGMAFGKYPDRTILVYFGKTRPFSDIVGRNVVYISNDLKKRQGLADRLRSAGCDVKIENRTDWHSAGAFDEANEPADLNTDTSDPDSDLAAFKQIRAMLQAKHANTYTPEIGSAADNQAERLVKKGLLKPGPLGGYMIARLF